MNYVRDVAQPLVEPVTLSEARLWMRIDDDDATQDAMVQLVIIAAREQAEKITGRSFARRQKELTIDEFPSDEVIELPYPPLISVDYVTYRDQSGVDQTLSGSPDAFLVDANAYPGRLAPLYGTSWPATQESIGAIRIGYTCGYAAPKDVPKLVRLYMQAFIATFYENREQLKMSNVDEMPRDWCAGLLDNLRVRTGFV